MNERTVTFEEMEMAYYCHQPIGEWYVTSMEIETSLPLPLTSDPDPNKIQFEKNGLLISFTVRKHE